MKEKIKYIVFIAVFMMICAYPLYGLLWNTEHEVTENKVLAAFPEIKSEEGKININYLKGLGDYFTDHFAARQELVTMNATLWSKLFKTSSEDIVLTGKDGWLFYKDSAEDYQGTRRLTDRGINNIAVSLQLIQEYCEKNGCRFIFTVAPNKNTLYPQYMPYYYKAREGKNTLELLEPVLLEKGVSYVDIKKLFLESGEVLYHTGDSHWNNKGALMVQQALLKAAGKEFDDLSSREPVVKDDFEGDLDKILYPLNRHRETEWDYSDYFTFAYQNDITDTQAAHLETVNESKEGVLVMVRDSFGNSLAPFMAQEFNHAYFNRTIPYRIDDVVAKNANVYIIEIVERNLSQFQKKAAFLPAPLRQMDGACEGYTSDAVSAEASNYNGYLKFMGMLDEAWTDDKSEVMVKLTGADGQAYVYEMFPANEYDGIDVTSDYGFAGYIDVAGMQPGEYGCEVITKKDGRFVSSGNILTINTSEYGG